MTKQSVAMLHYSAPPVVGGVEAVIKAHLKEFIRAGYSCTMVAGRGDVSALPYGTDFIELPEIDSQHPEIIEINRELENGRVPEPFEILEIKLAARLDRVLRQFDHLIVHNIFTKHFNLALTGALHRLLDLGALQNTIAWCHDFTWTSPSSRSKVRPGYPWDLLRFKRSDCIYVAVSQERQQALANLFECPIEDINLVYNGVDLKQVLGLSDQGMSIITRLGLVRSDINIIMPVRVTQAKNIEFALRVVAELKDMGIRPKLVVTGPPDPHDSKSMKYYQSLLELRRELGIENEMRFIFESSPDPDRHYLIDERAVGDLYRISDVMFMPSHREGFGMPVLEAGLAGIPVMSQAVPAAKELAGHEALIFSSDVEASQAASNLIEMVEQSAISRLRRRVRKKYIWGSIFENSIQPLLKVRVDS